MNKLTPYNLIQDKSDEIQEDLILEAIKNLCFSYIEYNTNEFQDEEELIYCIEFVLDKIIYLTELKSAFELKTSVGDFTRISHNLDVITLIDTMEFNSKSVYTELAFNIDNLLDKLELYNLILSKIMLEYYQEGEV